MLRKNLFGCLGFFCIVFLVLSQLNPDIIAQIKGVTTNWPEPVFKQLTEADGLPENSISCIQQDHLGFMWFGTQNGLVKYDGYSMKVYQPDPDDSLSISGRQIFAICEDRSGTLWIGTEHEGLNRFNRTAETFTRYNPDPEDSMRERPIVGIYEDLTGDLTMSNGNKIIIFNKKDKKFRVFKQDSINIRDIRSVVDDKLTGKTFIALGNKIMIYDPDKKTIIKDNKISPDPDLGIINSFFQAVDGTIWIAHSGGLAKFNSLRNSFDYYQPDRSAEDFSENNIIVLTEDRKGFIWGIYGSYGPRSSKKLLCFDPERGQFKSYGQDAENTGGLSSSKLWSLYTDNSGTMWIGTLWAGLNKWDRSKDKFKRISHDSAGESFDLVRTVKEDLQGTIWFGTNNGLYSFDRHTRKFQNYRYRTNHKDNAVLHIYIDYAGIIWFSTFTKGLGRFDRKNGSFQFYSTNPEDSMSPDLNYTTDILPDGKDILWVGTWGSGLNMFDKQTGKITRFMHDRDNFRSISNDQITIIYKDKRGNLWVGTNFGGLNLFNRADSSFKTFKIGEDETTTITAIYEDNNKNFWVGTYSTGLYLFDRDKGKPVYNISVKDGLSNNVVESILEDDSGTLWIGTDYGLSRFDPAIRRIRNYYTSEIFKENQYCGIGACKTSDGEMLFATHDGFIMFDPDSIKDDPVPPAVVIRNISLFNRPGEKLKIDGFIPEMKELDLSYDENDLRFDYVGLHYANPLKNRYKYKLEGYDKEWVEAGTQKNATYTNLDAGEYLFRVTACNEDGVWNKEGASIKIIIPPPFWAAWWAYGFYVIIFGSILYGIRKYEMNRLNWKNQSKLDEVKLKEKEETDRIKSRFFANISHEFRTPLTLILGPAENLLIDTSGENIKKQAGTIKRNAKRLLGLINQLLNLSKLEAGKLELKASKTNIVSFIKGITMSFDSVADEKDIELKVKTEKDEIELYFDKEKMTQIITNLLSNAFKFTGEGGRIVVNIKLHENEFLEVKLKDTGIGISEEELPKLFDRFYQVDSSQTREYEGTGLGLALTKELVELHHGAISVDSRKGEWTEFSIKLPVGRDHLKDEEIVEDGKQVKSDFGIEAREFTPVVNKIDDIGPIDPDKNLVLVVEDNADVREFIKDSLGNDFRIEEASNGEQGLRKAEKLIPDLIISDIMMPKMDGNELTGRIRNDEKTSHIPVILLTAKSEQESRLEGLETGADDYLIKPFDSRELRIRIKNLIDIRRKLQQRFNSGRIINRKDEKKLGSLDENFLKKVHETLERHLSEEEFSIEQFSEELGMSRIQLYRKLKALSGKSASNYLRSVRLSKARKMIEEQKGNISEIAYAVGFSSPQYFTRCFKEEFGYSPSELLN